MVVGDGGTGDTGGGWGIGGGGENKDGMLEVKKAGRDREEGNGGVAGIEGRGRDKI